MKVEAEKFSGTEPSPPSVGPPRTTHETNSQTKKRKRKGQEEKSNKKPAKSHQLGRRDEYCNLYSSIVAGATKDRFTDIDVDFHHGSSTQLGVSFWSKGEKNIFFNALSRLGRDALPKIAAAIETKSVMEVQDYILHLQDALALKYRYAKRNQHEARSLLSFYEIPAAFELSEKCCESMEKIADSIALDEEIWEVTREKSNFSQNWLLTQDVAKESELILNQMETSKDTKKGGASISEEDQPQSSGPIDIKEGTIPAAELLRLCNWLILSARVFMNSSQSSISENWRSFVVNSETPAIFHSAFNEFYKLTISITRRLVQTSLFQAQSRIRFARSREESSGKQGLLPKTGDVQRRDVLAALNILGMKHDSKEFWAKAPRRCGLKVYVDQEENSNDQERVIHLTYTETEARLGFPEGFPIEEDKVDYARQSEGYPESLLASETIDQGVSLLKGGGKIVATAENASSDDSCDVPKSSPSTGDGAVDEQAEDFIERFDARASRAEEVRLQELLNCPKDNFSIRNPGEDTPPIAGMEGIQLEEPVDWRARTEYYAEWENICNLLPEAESKTVANHGVQPQNKTPFNGVSPGYLGISETKKKTVPSNLGAKRIEGDCTAVYISSTPTSSSKYEFSGPSMLRSSPRTPLHSHSNASPHVSPQTIRRQNHSSPSASASETNPILSRETSPIRRTLPSRPARHAARRSLSSLPLLPTQQDDSDSEDLFDPSKWN